MKKLSLLLLCICWLPLYGQFTVNDGGFRDTIDYDNPDLKRMVVSSLSSIGVYQDAVYANNLKST